MTLGDLLLIVTVLGLAVLAARGSVLLATGRGRRGAKVLAAAVAWAALYAVALAAAGLASRPHPLRLGEAKCFDEWCVALEGHGSTPSGERLRIAVSNRGRRAQRPDSPALFLVVDGGHRRVTPPWLSERLEGGAVRRLALNVAVPPSARRVELLALEGGLPSLLSIGDENGPFHAKDAWRVR